jgi:hypothetical protein
VTSFDYRLHPLVDVLAGLVIHPARHARAVLRQFKDFAANAPDEFCGLAVIARAPPLPFLDPAWHGKPVVILALCWCGPPALGEQALRPLRSFGQPLADHISTMPYVHWQKMQDQGAPAGRQQYWKTANFADLSDSTIDVLGTAADDLPSPLTELHVQHMGGAVARVARGETAFAHRDVRYFVNLIGVAEHSGEFADLRTGVRNLYEALAPEALPGQLPNFTSQDDGDVAVHASSSHAERVTALRRRFDPAGLFSLA